MKIIKDVQTLDELKQMADSLFGDMVKGVVDVERSLLALDAELHSDLESLLLDDGSKRQTYGGSTYTQTFRKRNGSSLIR